MSWAVKSDVATVLYTLLFMVVLPLPVIFLDCAPAFTVSLMFQDCSIGASGSLLKEAAAYLPFVRRLPSAH